MGKEAEVEKMSRVTVKLKESLARKLRVEAAKEGVDARDIVTQALELFFRTRKGGKDEG